LRVKAILKIEFFGTGFSFFLEKGIAENEIVYIRQKKHVVPFKKIKCVCPFLKKQVSIKKLVFL
jgi:hypothetical protein